MYTSVNLAMLFWLGLLASDHHDVFKDIFILLQKVAFFCGGSWPSSSLAHSHPLFPGHCGGNHPLSMGTGLSFIWFWINHLCQWSLIIIVCCFDPLLSPSSPLGVNGSVAVTTHCSWVIITDFWVLLNHGLSFIVCCYQYAGCDNNNYVHFQRWNQPAYWRDTDCARALGCTTRVYCRYCQFHLRLNIAYCVKEHAIRIHFAIVYGSGQMASISKQTPTPLLRNHLCSAKLYCAFSDATRIFNFQTEMKLAVLFVPGEVRASVCYSARLERSSPFWATENLLKFYYLAYV